MVSFSDSILHLCSFEYKISGFDKFIKTVLHVCNLTSLPSVYSYYEEDKPITW